MNFKKVFFRKTFETLSVVAFRVHEYRKLFNFTQTIGNWLSKRLNLARQGVKQ